MRNKKAEQVDFDAFEDMSGGYAPNSATPTHFFGRENTDRIIHSSNKIDRMASRKRTGIQKKQAAKKARTRIEYCKPAPGITIAYEMTASENENLMQTEEPLDVSDSSLTDQRIIGEVEETEEERERRLDEEDAWVNSPESYGPSAPQWMEGSRKRSRRRRAQTAPGEDTMNPEELDMMSGNVTPGDDMMGEMPELESPDIELGGNMGQAREEGEIVDNSPGLAGYARLQASRYPGMPEKAEAIRRVMGQDYYDNEDAGDLNMMNDADASEYSKQEFEPEFLRKVDWISEDSYEEPKDSQMIEEGKRAMGESFEDSTNQYVEDSINNPDSFQKSLKEDIYNAYGEPESDEVVEGAGGPAHDGGAGGEYYSGTETDSHFARLLPSHLAMEEETPGEEREEEKEDQMKPPEDSFDGARASEV